VPSECGGRQGIVNRSILVNERSYNFWFVGVELLQDSDSGHEVVSMYCSDLYLRAGNGVVCFMLVE